MTPLAIERGLVEAMKRCRYQAGLGVPSVPTRYVVAMHPADRAWLNPSTEDRLARALTLHAERLRFLLIGEIEVGFRVEPDAMMGRPRYWAGFADTDLLVLAGPEAAVRVFERDRA